jgi:hypothetical protein
MNSSNRKVDDLVPANILEMHMARNIGARRTKIELGLAKDPWLSKETSPAISPLERTGRFHAGLGPSQ